jgi:hypothetical protein
MPGDASAHPNPSAAPVPVQPDPQETSFWPVVLTHLPLVQLPSLVQRQAWPAPEQAPPAALQPPAVQPCVHAPDTHVAGHETEDPHWPSD